MNLSFIKNYSFIQRFCNFLHSIIRKQINVFLTDKRKNIEKEIYFQFADYMFVVCLRYLVNREIAEEIMNDSFIKVFKNYHTFKSQGSNSLRNWIIKIMVNECLMYLRKKNQFELIEIEAVDNNLTEQEVDVFGYTDILNLIKHMPLGYRTVFNLYAIEGYSHKEISEIIGIKESTSRSQLVAARNFLKQKLIKQGYESARK